MTDVDIVFIVWGSIIGVIVLMLVITGILDVKDEIKENLLAIQEAASSLLTRTHTAQPVSEPAPVPAAQPVPREVSPAPTREVSPARTPSPVSVEDTDFVPPYTPMDPPPVYQRDIFREA